MISTKRIKERRRKTVFYLLGLATAVAIPLLYIVEIGLAINEFKPAEPKYDHFNTQYLHPYYFFFFPSSQEKLKKLNSPEAWIDSRGYRGDGPELRGKRKLAFLMGGSTAFGFHLKNNETISSYLNEIQKEYFFVTAGVPSWNSYQEFLRLSKQILKEKPSLVITLNGINDFLTAAYYYTEDLPYPLDTPESFDQLEKRVEDIRYVDSGVIGLFRFLALDPIFRHLFLTSVRAQLGIGPWPDDFQPGSNFEKNENRDFEEVADSYVENTELSFDLCRARGIKFMAFLQPSRSLSMEKMPASETEKEDLEYLKRFRAHILDKGAGKIIDLSAPFGALKEENAADFFNDEMHLTADANKVIAKMIARKLQLK